MKLNQKILRLTCAWLIAAGADEDRQQFVDVIQPLLDAKCVSCHGREKQDGGLRLDSFAAAKAGGDLGPAIVPGDAAKSLLVKAITFGDPDLQMPPKQKLSDKEIATLAKWVQDGAAWPEPVAVLFEDEPQFLTALTSGNGRGRLITEGVFAGKFALGMTPLQRDGVKIPGWNFVVREQPQPGEFRFLRLAWKKRGGGSVMIELASQGNWPDAKVANGRYVAGPNTTGWAAVSVAETAPTEWTVATFDLWKDIGDFTLTGFAPTCDRGEEAFFDSIILGPSPASLDAYRPGAGLPSSLDDGQQIGDALTDKRNPIRKLFRGERLDLWSLKKPVGRIFNPSENGVVGENDVARERSDVKHGRIGNPSYGAIDTFIRERLAKEGLTPSPEADRRTLIRRLTFDLTGLPPTVEDIAAFVADTSPDAYDALVHRLLDSPRYGERQARLWLDVVRYADTNGYERDEFRPLAWQYRDYVIRSFNQDKPFDQFIREQLAGDELISARRMGTPARPAEDGEIRTGKSAHPTTEAEADMLIATGFLRLGQWDSTASIFQEEVRLRAEQMADLTNTTASAFLGLTMSCCQCHDHKYDPFSQADHFRMRAFFAGVTPRDDLAVSLADEQAEIDRHNADLDGQAAPLKAEQAKLDKADKLRHEQLKAALGEIESRRRHPRRAMGTTDSGPTAPATHILFQGDFAAPRDEVPPGFVSIFAPGPASIEPPSDSTTGRRLALADWIASTDNPWAARVIVNRIWQQHFGNGLLATPNDFGFSGTRPTHPELLDWLAVEFTKQGWSIKKLHRMIVMSAAYRQASGGMPLQELHTTDVGVRPTKGDPDNLLLWRQNVRRLDAETLRDSLLAVSGLLKPFETGKPLWPLIPDELLKAQPAILEAEKGSDGGRMQGWYTDPIEQTDVRSVFLVRKRCLPVPFLQAFDLPDTTVSCARRDTTVVAPQALMFLNSPEAVRFAEALADRVAGKLESLSFADAAQSSRLIESLFQRTLGRSADADELKLATDLLKRHAEQHRLAGRKGSAERLALVDLCRAVLNLNEFAYVD